MACSNATAPIDINLSNSSGKCDTKCDYKFNYMSSSCIMINRNNYLSFTYDNSSNTQALYNFKNYNVKEIRIYFPSLHTYSNNTSDGEMIIIHQNNEGYSDLLVCIPIRIGSSSSDSGQFFTAVATALSNNAPSDGDSTTIVSDKYNLNEFVPKKEYFSYTATLPYQPCNSTINYVVFDSHTYCLEIGDADFKTITSIIKETNPTINKDTPFFYNPKGSVSLANVLDDQIYIDCNPIGESEETQYISTGGNIWNTSWLKTLNNEYGIMILAVVVVMLIILMIRMFSKMLFGKTNVVTMTQINKKLN